MHFKKSNVDDLANKLQTLCNDKALVKQIKAGTDEFIVGKYNWQDVAKSTYDLYQKVMKR
jgi:glycosyltransferase involved in cell wall biosynthesis